MRIGVVDVGLANNTAQVTARHADGSVDIKIGSPKSLTVNTKPQIDLILAIPRPARLDQLLPVVTCMGINRIALIGAQKVEKAYFGEFMVNQ